LGGIKNIWGIVPGATGLVKTRGAAVPTYEPPLPINMAWFSFSSPTYLLYILPSSKDQKNLHNWWQTSFSHSGKFLTAWKDLAELNVLPQNMESSFSYNRTTNNSTLHIVDWRHHLICQDLIKLEANHP